MNISHKFQRPVTGKDFFDREEILKILQEGKQNIALVGVRKAGKTSLLRQFIKKESADSIICYYSVPFEETLDYFVIRYFNVVASSYLKFKKANLVSFADTPIQTFRELTKEISKLQPSLIPYLTRLQTVKLQSKNKGHLRSVLEIFLEFPYLLAEIEGKEITIILDEFQNIAVLDKIFPDVLRQKIQEKENVFYYVAGSEISMMEDILNSYGAPLFGHFNNLKVDYFSYENARQFVLTLLKKENILINEMLLNYLILLTGGFPYTLSILVSGLVQKAQQNNAIVITKTDLLEVLQQNLFYEQGQLYIYFEKTVKLSLQRRRSGRYYEILKALSSQAMGITQLSKATGIEVTSLPKYVDGLLKTELIAKKNEAYFVKDSLMTFWLNAGLQTKENPILEVADKLTSFQQKLGQLVNSLKGELGIARESQVREVFVLSGRYQRVWGGKIAGQELDIIAQNKEGYLLGEIKINNVTVAQIKKFLEKVKKTKLPVSKKIFVTFMNTDQAAKKLAQSENIKLWDINKVNQERKKYKLAQIKVG